MRQNHSLGVGAFTLATLLGAGCTDSEPNIPMQSGSGKEIPTQVTGSAQIERARFGRSVQKYAAKDWAFYLSSPTAYTTATPTALITVPELPTAVAEAASNYLTQSTKNAYGDLVSVLDIHHPFISGNGDVQEFVAARRKGLLIDRAYRQKNEGKNERSPLTHEEIEAIDWNEKDTDIEARISSEIENGKDYMNMLRRNDKDRGSVRAVLVLSKPTGYNQVVQQRLQERFGLPTSDWGCKAIVQDGQLYGLEFHLRVAGTDGPLGPQGLYGLGEYLHDRAMSPLK